MADDRRPPPLEVIESLTRDPDGGGVDWTIVDGPWEFPGQAVAYVRQPGAFTDTFRVEVRLHESGADREAAARATAGAAGRGRLASIEDEYGRWAPLVGRQRVRLGDDTGILVRVQKVPFTGVQVEVAIDRPQTLELPAGGNREAPVRLEPPSNRIGWSVDLILEDGS